MSSAEPPRGGEFGSTRTGPPCVGQSLPLAVNRSDALREQRFFGFVDPPMFDRAGVVEGMAAVVYDISEVEVAGRAR
jgi:hypothetical protein